MSSGFLLQHGLAAPAPLAGGVVLVGNFDGVHRGHQALVEGAASIAAAGGLRTVVLTFEPHPRDHFSPTQPLFRLTPLPAKARLFEALGVDGLVVLAFDDALAQRSAESFVADVLVKGLAPRHVVIGWDFHFGRARGGSPRFLREQGQARGFGVTVMEAFGDEAGETISSSRLRAALGAGDIAFANGLFGYRWFVEGPIVHGDKRGRVLGYPTANMRLPASCGLKHGIYAVWLEAEGRRYAGVASYGRRPTFDDGEALLETHVFDARPDLYGRHARVTFYAYLRPERRFDSAEALVAQMDVDAAEARAALAAAGPGTALDRALAAGSAMAWAS